MIFVKITHPENGTAYDKKEIKQYLDVNKTYTLDFIDMGRSHTYVYLKECPIPLGFNSVFFDFYEEDGTIIDIYKDKRFNPFITNPNERPEEFYHHDHYIYLYERQMNGGK